MSPYAYTWNDPVNYTDPTGMMGERIGEPGGKNADSFWHIIFGLKHVEMQNDMPILCALEIMMLMYINMMMVTGQ